MSEARYAIVVAAGSGVRMGSKIPKQFLEMKGRPVIMHTLEAFYKCSPEINQILVLPSHHIKSWENMVLKYGFEVPLTLQTGGSTRFQSVKRGLSKVGQKGWVAIHDGVRPVVSAKIIRESFEVAKQYGSAIASVELKDSIREINSEGSTTCNRSKFKLVQTPQTFNVDLIKQAYELPEQAWFTDDASVWEAAGHKVTLFEGGHENIKITTIHDLVLAEILMKFI